MASNLLQSQFKHLRTKQHGFTLVEVMVSIVILMVGVLGVAQIVPVSILLNSSNRRDSRSLVLAQTEINQFIQQSLTAAAFTDALGNACSLGGTLNTFVGSPTITVNGSLVINFTSGKVAGYNFTYTDPNDPNAIPYDVRWAVYTFNAGNAKRFIVGTRRQGGNGNFLPVNLDTLTEK